jgi:transposase-like protein
MSDQAQGFLDAVRKVADAIGAVIVKADQMRPSDIPLEWEGEIVAGLRLEDLQGSLRRLIRSVERELGAPLRELSREDKQTAVRLLNERGAFMLRRSVEDVADAIGVSRITIYNYLNAIEAPAHRAPESAGRDTSPRGASS